MVGKTKVYQRYCTAIRKFVYGTDKTCDHFKFYPVFWCRKYEHWIQAKACIRRQKDKYEKCHKCKQGREIADLIKHEYLKEAKLKRKKIKESNSKLNRRKKNVEEVKKNLSKLRRRK